MRWLFLSISTVVILVSLQFGMIQGSNFQKEGPEAVMKKYLNAVLLNDYQTAYTFISESNEDIREWLEFLNFVSGRAPEKLISMIHLAHSLTRHQIIQTNLNNEHTAIIKVESTVPDMGKILEITHSEDEIKLSSLNGTLPLKQKQGTFILVKENDCWKIKDVEGASGDSASELAMDLAEKLLGKEEALKLDKEIKDYQNRDI